MQRKVILVIISILILTLSIIGLTYAFMRPQVEKKEEKSNITIKSCAKIQLKDNSSFINLENSYPMDVEKGLETKPYEFTITSTCEDYVGFNLYLTSLITNEIEDSNIHFAITSKEGTVLVSNILSKADNGLNDFNIEEIQELDKGIKGTHKNIYKVYSNNIPLKGESNYKLYLWVDKDASNDTMGKNFNIGLSIKSFNREETYADTCDKSLATCEIAQKVYENNTLFYHDANLKNGSEDLSYRFSGASDKVNNYVCLDDKETGACETDDDLYRIIGIFKNEEENYELKLIKAQGATITELGDDKVKDGSFYGMYGYDKSTYIGTNSKNLASYYWNTSNGSGRDATNTNIWQYSNLNKVNLNNYFYSYIIEIAPYLQNHITSHTWITGGYSITDEEVKVIYNKELGKEKVKEGYNVCRLANDYITKTNCTKNDIEYEDHVGIMYISDYMYGTIPIYWTNKASEFGQNNIKNNNWMDIGLYEWTISRDSAGGANVWCVTHTGRANYMNNVYYQNFGVRPSFYLTSDAKIKEGEGTKEMPYRIAF